MCVGEVSKIQIQDALETGISCLELGVTWREESSLLSGVGVGVGYPEVKGRGGRI